jgi:DNA primase (bacterial type)
MSSDIERIRRDYKLSDTAVAYGVVLEFDGNEFAGCCPFHNEDGPSFTIFTGRDHVERFQCFGCNEAGDVLDFVQKIKGVNLPEAIRILGGAKSAPNKPAATIARRDVYAGIVPIEAAEEITVGRKVRLYNPKRAGHEWEWGSFTPSRVFPYRRHDGSLVGYVLRRDLPDGGKETPMVMRVRLPDGRECWSRFPFPKPRPLYGLEKLGDGQVIVVEGEKCRDDYGAKTKRNVVTWPGGSNGINHVDWTPLAGRDVVIWPDADGPGIATAEDIAGIVHGVGARPRVIDLAW